MSQLTFEEIIKSIADRHGVTSEEVCESLEACIDFGMNNPDPAVKGQWFEMAEGKERPSISDLLTYTAGMAVARCLERGSKTQ